MNTLSNWVDLLLITVQFMVNSSSGKYVLQTPVQFMCCEQALETTTTTTTTTV